MPASGAANPGQKKGARFWLIFLSVCVSLFLSALDLTAVGPILPVIVHDLNGSEYSWVGTAYSLSSTAFLPMSAGMAQILGRRISLVVALLFFALGSALCGSAKSMGWLIAARAVQGLGGGAIMSLASIVLSDLVTLQERGTYNGILGMTWAVAIALGPVVGGTLAQHGSWRWLFYLNLPICCLALVLVILFVNLPTPKGTFRDKFFAMDWMGNMIVVSSSASLVIGLTWGGGRFPWSSANVLVPLILGCVGLVVWLVYETRFASHPMVSPELIGNRTTISGYTQIFTISLIIMLLIYYLPVYYQACKDAGPIRAGVNMLSGTLSLSPFMIASGISVTIWKTYRPQLWYAWVCAAVGYGVCGLLGATTSLGQAIGFSIIMANGTGIIFAVTYFPVLSPLPVSLNASALSFYAFLRSFGGIWGITVGSTIFTNRLRQTLPAEFLDSVSGGIDSVYDIIPTIRDLPQPLKGQVQQAFAISLRPVWYAAGGFSVIGFAASLLMGDVPLHNYLDEQWSMQEDVEESKKNMGVDVEGVKS